MCLLVVKYIVGAFITFLRLFDWLASISIVVEQILSSDAILIYLVHGTVLMIHLVVSVFLSLLQLANLTLWQIFSIPIYFETIYVIYK